MEKWVTKVLQAEKRKRRIPLEVKKLNNNFYLYHSTTRWSKEEKKVKKVSEYIGRMTPKGVAEKNSPRNVRSVYEYGNSVLLRTLGEEVIERLKEAFPFRWEEVFACAVVKTIEPLPLRLLKSRWEKLSLSREVNASLSPNTLTDVLRQVGGDYASQKQLFDSIMAGSKTLAFDLSSLFSYSENLKYAERGHNADHLYLDQVNFMLFFSIDRQLPVMLKPLPGSVRDVKALNNVIDELRSKKALLVLDRGFASVTLPDKLKEKGLSFILPLKRNFKLIDYAAGLEGNFIYRERGVKWTKIKRGEFFLYVFEDVKLRAEEETTFIKLLAEGKKNRTEYQAAARQFGKIAILSDLDLHGQKVYLMFKDREDVEQAFDSFKNELEDDKTCLGSDEAVRGFFFVSFVSLYLYYKVLGLLRKAGLAGKTSVREALMELSKVYEVDAGGKMKLTETPKKVQELADSLGLNLFPKKL